MENLQIEVLLDILKNRFIVNMKRHSDLSWDLCEKAILNNNSLFNALSYMESSGGEPDVIKISGEYVFVDTSSESPIGRRNCCYDLEAKIGRKKFPPEFDAMSICEEHNVDMLSVDDYHDLQSYGIFDAKTSSWLLTPETIRARGGALFGDNRYGNVFIYHNGADSYYGARGFRVKVKV